MSVARGKQFTTLRNGAPYGVGVPAPYRTTCFYRRKRPHVIITNLKGAEQDSNG